jgi:serine/threonine protein kinase
MSLEGQQLGEFEILERIGQGGMGAVYKARQTSLRRTVALKTLQAALANDVEYIARFQQEAVAAAGLSHPNLVQVFSAGENEGLHWFAMEYIEGESAKVRLKRKGRLDPLEAIAIAIHVATALEYGWRKAALIHRDIKPDNIFLSSDGEVKLGDLGLAKSAGQTQGLTMTGASMGTPHYISPEQVEAMKDVDLRADIYSLGCTLFHLLSGQAPFDGNSAVAIMMKHVNAPVPDLRSAWPECPIELATVVKRMMQKHPADRQQSYGEVNADLRRAYDVLIGAGVPFGATTTRQLMASQTSVAGERKRAAPVTWVVGAVAACVTVVALLIFLPSKKGGQSPEAERREKQNATQTGTPGVALARVNTLATPAAGKPLAVATSPSPNSAPAPTTPAPAPSSPAPSTPSPSAPPPSTPASSPAPMLSTEVEKWFAQVDGPQEETFQKQVLKPFEKGIADLRVRYLASLDANVAKASAAGQLAEALTWRTERQAFEKAQTVAVDDAGAPVGVQALRAAFRQQLAKLDQDRTAQARALLAPYDAILAKNQLLLTQHRRLDDAVLLKNKRDEITAAWLRSPLAAPAPSAASREWQNLIALVDPKRDAKSGEWKVENGALVCASRAPWALCEIPIDYHGANYDLRVSVTRGEGNELAILIPFRKGSTGGDIIFDYFAPNLRDGLRRAGLENLPGTNLTAPDGVAVVNPMWLPRGRRRTILVQVREQTLGVRLDDVEVFRWNADWARLRQSGGVDSGLFAKRGENSIFGVGIYDCEAVFHTIEMREAPDGSTDSFAASRNAPNKITLGIPHIDETTPSMAGKDQHFVNSLGMKFVPVPGADILMCIHETRRKDYAVYAASVSGVHGSWKNPVIDGKRLKQQDDHPVVLVSWEDATAFCSWLSRKEGRAYRLPTEHEWNLAVVTGLEDPNSISPSDLARKLDGQFPWGSLEPEEAGNYKGAEDGYDGTAPVMSFKPNHLGIYDLGGNAWEWCDGWFDVNHKMRVLRGGGFLNFGPVRRSSWRVPAEADFRSPPKDDFNHRIPGFRVVLGNSPAASASPPPAAAPPPR